MLLILTVVLMLAALALLILGLIDDSLGYIYGCIACSAAALLLLLAFSRLTRRRAVRLVTTGDLVSRRGVAGDGMSESDAARPVPTAAPDETDLDATSWDVDAGLPADGSVSARSTGPGAFPEPRGEDRDEVAAIPANGVTDTDLDVIDEWEMVFPIADYDELRVGEILPLLGELEADELEDVRDRELAGRNRASIVRRLEALLGESVVPAPVTEPGHAVAPRKAAGKQPTTKVPAARAAPAKAGAARKEPAKKTPAKKLPAKKVPASSKEAAPVKAPAVKAPAVKATPVKATPVKAPAVKATAVKATPVKATPVKAPAVKAPAVKATSVKATAVKATPVKASRAKAPVVKVSRATASAAEVGTVEPPAATSAVESIATGVGMAAVPGSGPSAPSGARPAGGPVDLAATVVPASEVAPDPVAPGPVATPEPVAPDESEDDGSTRPVVGARRRPLPPRNSPEA